MKKAKNISATIGWIAFVLLVVGMFFKNHTPPPTPPSKFTPYSICLIVLFLITAICCFLVLIFKVRQKPDEATLGGL
jgi:protein-S-isoprenylcysteine O-methyltransferase Ste14